MMKRFGRILGFVIGLWVCASTVEAAKFQKGNFSLIQYDENSSQLSWIEGGAFSEALQRNRQEYQLTPLTRQKNFTVSYFLNGLRKKVKLAFSPKVVIKPFILVEELQELFLAYQSQKREETASANETVQAKAMMPSDGMARAKQITNPTTFSFSPYYHRVYGIHLQIKW